MRVEWAFTPPVTVVEAELFDTLITTLDALVANDTEPPEGPPKEGKRK